ncbi:M48 family metallopeptidase [Comamonas sp. Y33R10-2]|uniref:M48 family metallopeptidase n=1 Tax=Comamonas sp. Y33R10-2 TaxID=2853257 RepID=UPI001C5C9198|nr:SprT family zinc-dependent metalloprotease [Comamonas sp. Y33R10-2]QXZ09297.1 M48 family metallopeptidase [Comamonas sp. Y33R10-2]
MSTGNSLQQAWQWLVPPMVEDGQGGLIPRGRLRAVDAKAESLAHELDKNIDQLHIDTAVDAIDFEGSGLEDAEELAVATLPKHPGASHNAQLQGRSVAYLLRRSARRSIGFSVGVQGLEVTAPQWLGMGDIESALQTKADWIVRKLQESGQRQQIRSEARILWQEGGLLDYLGQPMTLRLTGEAAPPLRTRQTYREQVLDGAQSLHLPLGAQASAAQIRAAVQAWIFREARTHFTARMQYFAVQMDVRWSALRLSSASTRWGSATSGGVIRLNWRLMQHSPQIIDYVVVHELAHLHHMDHSPKFWAVVAQVLPDWKQLRKALRNKPLPAWE